MRYNQNNNSWKNICEICQMLTVDFEEFVSKRKKFKKTIDKNLQTICDYVYFRFIDDNRAILCGSADDIDNEKTVQFSNVRLQKLLFLFYGLYFTYVNKELFDAQFEAWKNGPVIRSIYAYFHECRNFLHAYRYIPFCFDENSFLNENNFKDELDKFIANHDNQLSKISKQIVEQKIDIQTIDKIYKRFNFLETFMLVNAIHKMAIYRDYFIPGQLGCKIPKDELLKFFDNELLK